MIFVADEIATALPSGQFLRLRPGRLEVRGKKIHSVARATQRELSQKSSSIRRVRTLIPALVDCHTHLIFSGNRAAEWGRRLNGESYQQIAASGGGIRSTMRATRSSSAAELTQIAKSRLQTMLSFGVGTVEIKSGYGLDLASEIRILKVIQSLRSKTPQSLFATFMGAHAIPPEFSNENDYADFLIHTALPKVRSLADFQDVFCEKGYFSAPISRKILEAGRRLGLQPRVHAHEFGRTGGVQVAAQVGALSADHLMVMNSQDLQLLKKAKVVPVILPGTSFFLGAKKFAPALKMKQAGLPIAIASDFNPGTNPTLNFPLCGTFAAIHQGLSLEDVLTAQTRNAALALGLKDRGSLAPGYRADLVEVEGASFEEIYYSYGSSRVSSVYLEGKQVYGSLCF